MPINIYQNGSTISNNLMLLCCIFYIEIFDIYNINIEAQLQLLVASPQWIRSK